MKDTQARFPYPRRRVLRAVLQRMARVVLRTLCRFRIVGKRNFPQSGPLIIVANHFHFVDTVALIATVPWPLEFLGGFQLIDAPDYLKWLPQIWGYYPVRRGSVSRTAMRAATAVMEQDGVLGIFPEGGSWAKVLCPARPGTAFLAAQTGAPLLPIGLDGLTEMFPALRNGRRAAVTVRIGEPIGPFAAPGRGRARRARLEEIGDEIMRHIADLIPPEKRGVYANDPDLRAAAQEVAAYPYHNLNQ